MKKQDLFLLFSRESGMLSCIWTQKYLKTHTLRMSDRFYEKPFLSWKSEQNQIVLSFNKKELNYQPIFHILERPNVFFIIEIRWSTCFFSLLEKSTSSTDVLTQDYLNVDHVTDCMILQTFITLWILGETYVGHVHFLYITHVWHVHTLCITHVDHVHIMLWIVGETYVGHVHDLYITHVDHVHFVYITYVDHVYFLYITHVGHVHLIYILVNS